MSTVQIDKQVENDGIDLQVLINVCDIIWPNGRDKNNETPEKYIDIYWFISPLSSGGYFVNRKCGIFRISFY